MYLVYLPTKQVVHGGEREGLGTDSGVCVLGGGGGGQEDQCLPNRVNNK